MLGGLSQAAFHTLTPGVRQRLGQLGPDLLGEIDRRGVSCRTCTTSRSRFEGVVVDELDDDDLFDALITIRATGGVGVPGTLVVCARCRSPSSRRPTLWAGRFDCISPGSRRTDHSTAGGRTSAAACHTTPVARGLERGTVLPARAILRGSIGTIAAAT